MMNNSRKINRILCILLSFALIGYGESQKCSSPDISEEEFKTGYNNDEDVRLSFSGVIKNFAMSSTTKIEDTINNNGGTKYIDARLTENALEIYTTENFPKYGEEQTSTLIILRIVFVCNDGSKMTLIFRQGIKKTNEHDPEFSKSLYEIKLPLPLYKGFDLSYFEPIIARDIDIFDNKVTFTSENSGIIAVGTSTNVGSDEKTFYATLTLTEPLLSLTESIEFSITATDSGTPPRNSTAQVRIFADKEVTLPPQPRFEKILYQGVLNDKYELAIEDAVILNETFSEEIQFKIENGDYRLFDITNLNNRITIKLAKDLTDDDISGRVYFSFEIIASRADVMDGKTAVVVSLPQTVLDYHFTKSLYTGSLNSSGALSIEDIRFDAATYSPDIKFSLKGSDSALFEVTNHGNEIEINFSNDVQGGEIRNRQYLFIVLVAFEDAYELTAAAISISLPRSPKFEQSLYRGSIDKQSSLYVDNIFLETDNSSTITSLTLKGDYSEIFNIEQSNNEIVLELTRFLTEREIRGIKFISLEITAINSQQVEGSTQVLLVFPTFLEIPQFVQALHKGSINNDGDLVLDEIVLRNVTYTDGMKFQLQGDGAEYFRLEENRNIVKIILERPIPIFMIQEEKYLVLILVAANTDGDSGSTSILLDLPVLTGPEFTKLVYKGFLNNQYELNIESIYIKENTYEDGIEFSLVGNDSKFFQVSADKWNVIFELKSGLNTEEFEGKSYLECNILARTKNGQTGSTLILIEVPLICEEPSTCPVCPSTTTSAPCGESTPKPSIGLPTFDKPVYGFRLGPEYIGTFGKVAARVEDPNIQLVYTTNITSDHLLPRITIDHLSGQLTVTDMLSPGSYAFEVIATNPLTTGYGQTTVKLQVKAVNQCPTGMVVNKVLLVKHIYEEEEYNDIFNTTYGQCEFTIYSLEPNDKEYVTIDQTNSMLTTIRIDREDPVFSNMIVPQVQVQLLLECNEYTRQKRDTDYRSLVLTEDIDYATDVTMLSLIIEDINDHSPEFVYPEKAIFMVGYPEISISHDLMPEHLIKVKATDKDIGLNAMIQYRIKSNDYFGIDPISGVIYPFANIGSNFDNTILEVYAIDRNGGPDGRQTNVTIVVRVVQSQHLTLLSIKNRTSEDLESCLKDLQSKANIGIFDIKHAVLPDFEEKKEEYSFKQYQKADHPIVLKSWIYAFDQHRELLDSSEIADKLSDVPNAPEITALPYTSERQSGTYQGDSTGYVAGISVLTILLVIVVAGGFIIWWFWLRPSHFKEIYNETSETVSSEGSMDHEMRYKNAENGYYDENYESSQYKKRESMAISGSTTFESTDDSNASSFEALHEAENNGRIQNEKRKSQVTFNELVERIEIEIGHNNFRNNNDSDVRL